jgi:hypothetical protein
MPEEDLTCSYCTRVPKRLIRGVACPTCYARLRNQGRLGELPITRPGPNTECAAEGCADVIGRHGGRGYCPKHYQRLTKSSWGLEQPTRTADLATRFQALVAPEPCSCGECSGCFLWQGGVNKKTGYGHFTVANRTQLAHRVAWVLANDRPIPEGLVIDHVYKLGCRHRHCIRAEHLEAVTTEVNNRRIPITRRRLAR